MRERERKKEETERRREWYLEGLEGAGGGKVELREE